MKKQVKERFKRPGAVHHAQLTTPRQTKQAIPQILPFHKNKQSENHHDRRYFQNSCERSGHVARYSVAVRGGAATIRTRLKTHAACGTQGKIDFEQVPIMLSAPQTTYRTGPPEGTSPAGFPWQKTAKHFLGE